MTSEYIQIQKKSPWIHFVNRVARSWIGERLSVQARMCVEVKEGDLCHRYVLRMSPEEHFFVTKMLVAPIPLQSLGIPSHGALCNSGGVDCLVRGLKRLRSKQSNSVDWHVSQQVENSQRVERELRELLKEKPTLDDLDLGTLIDRINRLLILQNEGISVIRSHLNLLIQQINQKSDSSIFQEEKRSISSKDLIRDCRVLTGMIDALPENLELPENSPLRYMLDQGLSRLTLLLDFIQKDPTESKIFELVEEFVRIEEVLHSDLACSPHLKGRESCLLPFTAKLQQLCRRYSMLYAEEN